MLNTDTYVFWWQSQQLYSCICWNWDFQTWIIRSGLTLESSLSSSFIIFNSLFKIGLEFLIGRLSTLWPVHSTYIITLATELCNLILLTYKVKTHHVTGTLSQAKGQGSCFNIRTESKMKTVHIKCMCANFCKQGNTLQHNIIHYSSVKWIT